VIVNRLWFEKGNLIMVSFLLFTSIFSSTIALRSAFIKTNSEKKSNEKDHKETKKYHCPRCKSTEIYDYGERFDCMKCILEFEKKDFETLDDEDILSTQEKLKIVNIFKNNTDIFFEE
jgi:ribosomal protein S27AE